MRAKICQTISTRTWSSSGRTLAPDALEEAAGERLRLQEYTENHTSDALAGKLATVLAESQPPLQVSALILRQWFTKYHPDSGALACATVKGLESALGDVLRSVYQGMGYQELQSMLDRRRKAALVSNLFAKRGGRSMASQLPHRPQRCGVRASGKHTLRPPSPQSSAV